MSQSKQGLKNRVRYPSTISKDNLAELQLLSKQSRIPISSLMDEALEMLFVKYTNASQPNVSQTPTK